MMKSRGYVVRSYEMMKCQSDCEMMKSLSTKKNGKLGQNLESLILERVQILRKNTYNLGFFPIIGHDLEGRPPQAENT